MEEPFRSSGLASLKLNGGESDMNPTLGDAIGLGFEWKQTSLGWHMWAEKHSEVREEEKIKNRGVKLGTKLHI